MKNNIYKYIFVSRFRQPSERKRNIIVCVAAVLVGFIISLSNNVYGNTLKDNIMEIESVYGKFDISIMLNNTEKMVEVEKVLEDFPYVIIQDSELEEKDYDYNFVFVNSIDDYLKYNNEDVAHGNAIISEAVAYDLDIRENETVEVNGNEYIVSLVSDDINCILNNNKDSLLIESDEKEWKSPTYLLYLDHSEEDINMVQKIVSETLDNTDYIISSNYNTYSNMVQDMKNLGCTLMFFIIIIAILSGFMITYSYNNVFIERMKYWNTLRCIGLSSKNMVRAIGFELAVYVGIGTVAGIVLGSIGAFFICKAFDITVFDYLPDIWTYVGTFAVCFINILLIIFTLKRKIKNSSIIKMKNVKRKSMADSKTKIIRLVSCLFVLLTIITFLVISVCGESFLVCVFFILVSIITLFIMINYFCDLHKYLTKKQNTTLYLCGTNMRSHYMLTKGMSVSLTIIFSVLFLLNSVILAYEQTAVTSVDRQIKYDLMIYKEGKVSFENDNYINKYKYSTICEDVGKVNSDINIYLCGLQKSDIFQIYSKDIFEGKDWDGQLHGNQIVVSHYISNIYNWNIGDSIDILYDGKEYQMEIYNIINTNDFLSQVIYFNLDDSPLSNEFVADKNYCYFKGDDREIAELKEYFLVNNEFTVMDTADIKKQWIENTSSALKPMRAFTVVICISLLIVALCMLFSASKEKKYDYSLMILMGYRQRQIYKVIFIEIMCVIMFGIFIAYIFFLLCNDSIIYILGLISDYELVSVSTWNHNLLMAVITVLATSLVVFIFSKRMMKGNVYNMIIKGSQIC